MLEEYLTNGEITYCKNISKNSNISKDLFKINYDGKTMFLLCTSNGLKVTKRMLIS